ncbi:MAG: mycofactocin biosynthesis chaperone MftB [Deltaproteobacteria bacterium]|nr:mycofactocin biosynthesis chaperone MftB [Deltaproteobacteria bacterium]
MEKKDVRYALAAGVQVREEDFGLLFYSMAGPRLYFVSSGDALDSRFFRGEWTLYQWINQSRDPDTIPKSRLQGLSHTLSRLVEQGVLLEC